MINQDRLITEFIKYVKIDSETRNEKEFADFLVEKLKNLGMEVFVDNAGKKVGSNGYNVYAKFSGTLDKEPILLCSHMDTVVPGVNINPVIKDGVIYSDGSTVLGADDKSGIAAIIEAIRVVKENNICHRDFEVVFTIYEEGGLRGSKNLDYDKLQSKKAIVFDSSGDVGKIIVQAPAQDKIYVKILGKSAHAGVSPEDGINAIVVAADGIANMKLLRIDEETTANIGIINGGKATNIVTPQVNILLEARSLNHKKLDEQTKHMVSCFEKSAKKFGAKVEINIKRMYDAFKIDDDDEIVMQVKKAFKRLGIEAETASTGGGSDANVLNRNGIKAVNVGTGMTKVHTTNEHIKIESLVNITKFALNLITGF